MCKLLLRAVMFVLGLLIVNLVSAGPSWGQQDLLELVRAGNQSAIQSIRTFSCQITFSQTPRQADPFLGPAEYWRSGDSLRIREGGAKIPTEFVLHDLKTRTMRKVRDSAGKETIKVTLGQAVPDQRPGKFDAWFFGLLSFPGPEGTALTFDEVLKKPHKLQNVKRETKDGRQFIVVAFANEPVPNFVGEYEIWFDPHVNYLARKLVMRSWKTDRPKPEQRREAQVLRFKEAAPAIYFPEQVESRFYKDDQLGYTEVVTFSDIRINQPLPPNTFVFPPLPAGATVFDSVQGKAYTTDADGTPKAGSSAPLAKFPPLPPGAVEPAQTAEEPKSMTRWILPGSLAILALAGGIWLFRKWRVASAEVN